MVRIETVQPLAGFRLKVRFNDGLEGVYPVEPERRGGVFLKLLDARVFNAVTINPDFGCVEWPGGVDLCPDTMRQAMSGAEPVVESSLSTLALREEAPTKSSTTKEGR
jgi:hypothetical protein